MVEAKKQLQIIMVRKMNEAAAAERKRRDLEKQAKEKAEGKSITYDGDSNTPEAWGKGTGIAEAKKAQAEYEARYQDRRPREAENNAFVKGQNVVKADSKKEDAPRIKRDEN